MRRISGKLAGSAILLTLALGCNPEQSVRPRSLAFEATTTPAPTLVLHVVAPQATDRAIDQGLDDHYVWLDTTARSNHKLFVFLPGTGQNPSIFQLVQQEAARLGYHVIGLMYPTGGGLAKACPSTTDPSACYENARLEIIDGIDRVAFLNVSVANSIDNRSQRVLRERTPRDHRRNRPGRVPERQRGEQHRQPTHQAAPVPDAAVSRRRVGPIPPP